MTSNEKFTSVFQHGSAQNDGFYDVSAFLATPRQRKDISTRPSRWTKLCKQLRQRCEFTGADRKFELNDFWLIVKTETRLRIVVFSSITNKLVSNGVFTGTDWIKPDIEINPTISNDEFTVWILQDYDAYYWIRSIGGFMGKTIGNSGQKFCPLCFGWIRGRFEFHRCAAFQFRCDECGTTQFKYYDLLASHRNQTTHGPSKCEKCGRLMATGDCYERHMIWCKSRKLEFASCVKCKDSYNVKYEHECGVKYCTKCCKRYDTSIEHRCYLTRDKAFLSSDIDEEEDTEDIDSVSNSEDGMDQNVVCTRPYHYAYDIECQLNPSAAGDNDSEKADHVVCLVMVAPLYVHNAEVLKFYNLEDFFKWVLKKERGKCTFWAHNAKGYDNRLLFNYLCSVHGMKPGCLWQANKLLQIRVGTRRFNDSICHVARPLCDWPATLGLTGNYVKGFFPHKFNTEANKNYVGPLPPKDTFGTDRMKTDRLVKFEKWYAEEQVRVGDKWNLQENMETYCESDVLLLKEGLEVYDGLMSKINNGMSPLSSVTSASYAMKVYRNLDMPLETVCELKQDEYKFVKEAFKGGRTSVRCLQKTWSTEEIEAGKYGVYIDIQSMYPAVQYYNDMPCGIPRWKLFDDMNQPDLSYLESFMGFAECDIEPTKYLHHPIIGKTDPKSGKYAFSLNELEKTTITSVELQMALKHGYKVTKVYRVLEFDRTKDLFKSYIRKFLKIKLEASGFNGSDQEWDEFQRKHREVLGIELERKNMIKNKGKREMAKLLLNSLWGKFGQRPDLQEDKFYSSQEFKALLNEEMEGNVTFDEFHQLSSGFVVAKTTRSNFASNLKNKNVAVAAFVAAGGRLKLWETLHKLDDRVLYHDTDSILYERDPTGYNVETGGLLGEWADEYPGDKVVDFC